MRFLLAAITTILALTTLLGCRYPNEFTNQDKNKPHATLHGSEYPKSGSLSASHINDQPTSFWRIGDTFRVPIGKVSFTFAYSSKIETLGYKKTSITTTKDAEYQVIREQSPNLKNALSAIPHPETPDSWIIHDKRDSAAILLNNPDGSNKKITSTPKEDYIFGIKSKNAAIKEYLKKNP